MLSLYPTHSHVPFQNSFSLLFDQSILFTYNWLHMCLSCQPRTRSCRAGAEGHGGWCALGVLDGLMSAPALLM